MDIMHAHALTPAVAYAPGLCPCTSHHQPRPVMLELHHDNPPMWMWERVHGTPHGNTHTVPLCPTAHTIVHNAINEVLLGRPRPPLPRGLRPIVAAALAYATAHALQPPFPPPLVPAEG